MEPRASLSLYVAVVLLAAAGLSARGLYTIGLVVSLSLAAWGAGLDASYMFRRRHRKQLALPHRRYLDRLVRIQYAVVAVGGCAIPAAFSAAAIKPFAHSGALLQATVVGLAVASSTVYASSLIDWFWILPKISGIIGPPPCTRVGGKYFAGVTSLWYFHRSVATTAVTFVLAAVPSYAAGTVHASGAQRSALTLIGAALAIGWNSVNAGSVAAFKQFLSPRVLVGGYVRVRKSVEDPTPEDGYVVDVSIQGIKYKLESEVNSTNPRFVDDGELLPINEIERVPKSGRTVPMCPSLEQCRAVNWYCLRNRNANVERWPDQREPAELPESWLEGLASAEEIRPRPRDRQGVKIMTTSSLPSRAPDEDASPS